MNRDLFNFRNIAYNLLNTTDDIFERFFEKLYNMDKEYLYIYLITRKDRISKSQITFAKTYYERRKHYYNWNLKYIYVCNSRKVSQFFSFPVAVGSNLLTNDRCIDFILKYNHYFQETSIHNFKSFTKETKLNLTNFYTLKLSIDKHATWILNQSKHNLEIIEKYKTNNYISAISFNELGSSLDRSFNFEIYHHDLLVVNETDEMLLKDNHIIVDGDSIYTLNNKEVIASNDNENLCYEIRYEMSTSKTVEEKKQIVKEKYNSKHKFKDGVKQLYLSSFQELFVLYNNGDLYKDNELYATNVLTIWEANSYVSYLVFKNNDVEYISSHSKDYSDRHYEKVIFNEYYIAFLKDRNLEVVNICEDPDKNYHTFFYEIDDIENGKNVIDIKLIKGKESIIHSTGSYLEDYEF